MNKRWLIIIVVLVLVGGALAWYFIPQDDKNNESTADVQVSEQLPLNTEPADGIETPAIEEVELKSVNNYEGSGIATRTISGKYTHNVTANIGAPAAGKFYEGWIVGSEGFISTGKLTQEVEGVWSLAYTSNDNLLAYNQVVITEETESNGLDNKPETHVLEGEF